MPVALSANAAAGEAVQHIVLPITSREAMDFVDVTARLQQAVADSSITEGVLMIQSRHTTAGLLINEDEPLLIDDLREMFERLVPTYLTYRHDDFHRRNLTSTERVNGHAHCRAALLRTSEYLAISKGALSLGRWQRVFFVDFDGGQQRELWLTVMGRRTLVAGAKD
jgi:secondary thiamine-phosphate synthase enzyme